MFWSSAVDKSGEQCHTVANDETLTMAARSQHVAVLRPQRRGRRLSNVHGTVRAENAEDRRQHRLVFSKMRISWCEEALGSEGYPQRRVMDLKLWANLCQHFLIAFVAVFILW